MWVSAFVRTRNVHAGARICSRKHCARAHLSGLVSLVRLGVWALTLMPVIVCVVHKTTDRTSGVGYEIFQFVFELRRDRKQYRHMATINHLRRCNDARRSRALSDAQIFVVTIYFCAGLHAIGELQPLTRPTRYSHSSIQSVCN